MNNFWQHISYTYNSPSLLCFICNDEIDVHSAILVELNFLIDYGYIRVYKNKADILKKDLHDLSKTQQYLMRILAGELDFNEKIFKALIITDGKNRNILVNDITFKLRKFLMCFLPFILIFIIFSLINIISDLHLPAQTEKIFNFIKIAFAFAIIFVYSNISTKIRELNSLSFILKMQTAKDKKILDNFLKDKNNKIPNKYIMIFTSKDNSKNELLNLIL